MVIWLQNFGKLFPAQTSAPNELSRDLAGGQGGWVREESLKEEN